MSRVLVLLVVLMLGVSAVANENGELRELLGNDFDGAKIVARQGEDLVTIDLRSWTTKNLGTYPSKGKFDGMSRPWWSPDGKEIAFSHAGKAFVVSADGSNLRRILEDQKSAYEPIWWDDPQTGERCIVFKTTNDKHWYGKKVQGETLLYRTQQEKYVKLADFPCDGGLSLDGTHLGEAYGGCLIVDVIGGEYHVLNQGNQACNGSMSPDNTYRLLHLNLPHDFFDIRNKYDKQLWRITKPKGTQEWQSPRWSNHPNFCMATLAPGYYPVVVQIDTQKIVQLKSLGNEWGPLHLWLPSGEASGGQAGSLSLQDGENKLKEADALNDAFEAQAVYRELAEKFRDQPLGEQAQSVLDSAEFQKDLAAAPILRELTELEKRLRPIAEAKSSFEDPEYLRHNQGTLVIMVDVVSSLVIDHAGTRAARAAAEIIEKYALPPQTSQAGNRELVLDVTIQHVSKVPDPAQIRPYTEAVCYVYYAVDQVVTGDYDGAKVCVVHWGMRDAQHTEAAGWQAGMRQRLTIDLFDAHRELHKITAADDAIDFDLTPYWALKIESPDSPAPEQRTWADSTGRFTVEATFVEVRGESVVLKRKDGKSITVPINRLSDADQRYIEATQQR